MKWKVRRMVEKCMLFLVGIKPVRWFFDQLKKLGDWAQSKPWIQSIWKWYAKLFKPCWIGYLGYCIIIDAWNRNAYNVFIDIICLMLVIFLPDANDRNDDNEDEDEPNDPSPTGDAVEMWLKEQQKVNVK